MGGFCLPAFFLYAEGIDHKVSCRFFFTRIALITRGVDVRASDWMKQMFSQSIAKIWAELFKDYPGLERNLNSDLNG